ALPNGAQHLLAGNRAPQIGIVEPLATGGDRAGRDENHLVALLLREHNRAGKLKHALATQAHRAIGQNGSADFDDNTQRLHKTISGGLMKRRWGDYSGKDRRKEGRSAADLSRQASSRRAGPVTPVQPDRQTGVAAAAWR